MKIWKIIREQQPEIYNKLVRMITMNNFHSEVNPGQAINKIRPKMNLGNTGLKYVEQLEDPEDNSEFRRVQRLVTERKAVEI